MKKTLFLGALLASSAAMADPQPNTAASSASNYNPSQVVCRTISETGSRLERSRVCMTRAQWDQHNRDTRSTVDRAQEGRVLEGSH